ncbi:hypothetical protein FDW96_04645 [Citrobacter sp. TBCS-15]|nr:hypothetical protein FDW96_04645 [Citrobacter sp. TBCS-15]TKU49837.1 hypothetical protein FDX11_08860 [Citrobacter sp. wls714]TKU73667.1 hypothetical protein FDX14_09380 [Citrobacter sp. wls710]
MLQEGTSVAQKGDIEGDVGGVISSQAAPFRQEKIRAIMAPFTYRRKIKSRAKTSQINKHFV